MQRCAPSGVSWLYTSQIHARVISLLMLLDFLAVAAQLTEKGEIHQVICSTLTQHITHWKDASWVPEFDFQQKYKLLGP